MNAQELIDYLGSQKITLSWDGESIEWTAPFDFTPSDEILEIFRKNRLEIVKRIGGPPPEWLIRGTSIVKLIEGNCLGAMARMPENLVDLIATDPPYGLEYMGKDWDQIVPPTDIWKECYRVLKPGGFAFVMSAPRQDVLSRMIANLQDVGFETKFTSIYWTYSSGVPKSHNIGKILDKRKFKQNVQDFARFDKEMPPLGEDKSGRKVIKWTKGVAVPPEEKKYGMGGISRRETGVKQVNCWIPVYESDNPYSEAYAGFQPKPAVEVILIAMKPLKEKTFVDQVLKNGKGVTYLDDCLIPFKDDADAAMVKKISPDAKGRKPGNLIVSDDVLGKKYSRFFSLDAWACQKQKEGIDFNEIKQILEQPLPFLIVPKPSDKERNFGCKNLTPQQVDKNRKQPDAIGCNNPRNRGGKERKNYHPTVKPIQLMAYLIALGSRKGEIVLDPFCGSGTTCLAGRLSDRAAIGIEMEPKYFEIADAKMRALNMLSHFPNRQKKDASDRHR